MGNIKSFLRKFPSLYHLLQEIYYGWRRILEEYIIGTKLQELIWKNQDIFKGGGRRKCRDALNHPHRGWLIEEISAYAPFESILEVGCNMGFNLHLLAKKFPEAKLYGIDINSKAIQEGKIWLKNEMGIRNIELFIAKADELKQFNNKSIDAAFTDATLLYIGPDKIGKVIKEMTRITRKIIIFNEWHCENISEKKDYFYYYGHWIYNYKAILQNIFPSDNVKINKLPRNLWNDESWERFGSIIKVRL